MGGKKRLGVGVISLGWMGRLHTRSYKAVAEYFPELGVEVELVAAADGQWHEVARVEGNTTFDK